MKKNFNPNSKPMQTKSPGFEIWVLLTLGLRLEICSLRLHAEQALNIKSL